MSGITTQVLWILELCYRWQKFCNKQMVFKRNWGSSLEQDIPVTANFGSNSFSLSMPAVISSSHESSGHQYHMPFFWKWENTTQQQDPRYYSILHISQENESVSPMEGRPYITKQFERCEAQTKNSGLRSRLTISEIKILTSIPLFTRLRKWTKATTY